MTAGWRGVFGGCGWVVRVFPGCPLPDRRRQVGCVGRACQVRLWGQGPCWAVRGGAAYHRGSCGHLAFGAA